MEFRYTLRHQCRGNININAKNVNIYIAAALNVIYNHCTRDILQKVMNGNGNKEIYRKQCRTTVRKLMQKTP